MARIFITRDIPGKALEDLKQKHEVVVFKAPEGEKISRAELLKQVQGVEAVISLLTEEIDAEFFDVAGPQLKIVANYAVGFDNMNVEEALKRGIWLTNTPSNLGDSVAEFALSLMLALARRVVEADAYTRAGKYRTWDPNIFLGQDLTGKTLGIIGAGTIGSVVAQRAKAVFNMPVLYCGRSRKEDFEAETGATFVEQDELIKQADVISLHVPLMPATRHMISTKEFEMMKPTTILLNTARGPVIDENAMIQALEQNKIWGVGLDVYEGEDATERAHLPLENWNKLINSNKVIMTPHIASATLEAREEMTAMVVASVLQALEGKEPPCLVPGCKDEK